MLRLQLSSHADAWALRIMPFPTRIHWTRGIREGHTKEHEAHSKQLER